MGKGKGKGKWNFPSMSICLAIRILCLACFFLLSLVPLPLSQALLFLYSRGFPSVGHVHTGNVLVEGRVCYLTGYENALLGYRTRNYRLLHENLQCIDTVMFGETVWLLTCTVFLLDCYSTQGENALIHSKHAALLQPLSSPLLSSPLLSCVYTSISSFFPSPSFLPSFLLLSCLSLHLSTLVRRSPHL